ncbi:uncharacterized protein LOC6580989 [Drosophila mojavensis]|uniref:uncharacterized protein LOC6580989 n=1 Tax=Drosophila mojavensis TaxID=7230 RepID=UPI0013EE627B|nr:uncharacterized protein LOC6580989 [Drosophila mojavensis]
MDLAERTRCISITWALLIIVCQTMCESVCVSESPSQSFATALTAVYYSHRMLFLAGLGTLALTLLGCLGCLLCTCCRLARRRAESLDSYAPRTQSIVWPSMPTETARVLELTFLHTPDAVDCICRGCSRARKERCLEDCLNGTESKGKETTIEQIMGSPMELLLSLLLLLLVAYPKFLEANNFTGDDWFNGTHLLDDVDNTTAKSNGYAIIRNTKEANIHYVPLDPLRRVAFVALLLHILIVGGGLIIYSIVCCKSRTDRKRLLELKRRLQSPPTLQHIPNSPNCPCHGCRVARQILSGLIVQQIINERAERE